MDLAQDPRRANTMEEAALNDDGKTYNGARAIAWLSECLLPGRGFSPAEVDDIFREAKARRSAHV